MTIPQRQTIPQSDPEESNSAYSLRELIDLITGRSIQSTDQHEDFGLAEPQPFPFMAIVGQLEMKIALLLALINPSIGGVLLIGPRGTGKTTAVRALTDLLPVHKVSNCYYGCTAEDITSGGMDAVCPDCARKFGEGQSLTRDEQARMVELPLNARLEDVVGGIDERAAIHDRLRLKRGILAQADMNLLYVDEVNLLSNEIVDAILDAAALGTYNVRRGPISSTYHARFTLIGSMNPEEGRLRPQILDRFGLRIVVKGLENPNERIEAYRRVHVFQKNSLALINQFAHETETARQDIQRARDTLPMVVIPEGLIQKAIDLIRALNIDSLRAEITLLEAARALAAADGRSRVELSDIQFVAPMALRMRQSHFMEKFFQDCSTDESSLQENFLKYLGS